MGAFFHNDFYSSHKFEEIFETALSGSGCISLCKLDILNRVGKFAES